MNTQNRLLYLTVSDPNLSWQSRGLAGMLISLFKHGKDVTITSELHFTNANPDSVTTIRAAIQKLETHGYLTRTRKRYGKKASGNLTYWKLQIPKHNQINPKGINRQATKLYEKIVTDTSLRLGAKGILFYLLVDPIHRQVMADDLYQRSPNGPIKTESFYSEAEEKGYLIRPHTLEKYNEKSLPWIIKNPNERISYELIKRYRLEDESAKRVLGNLFIDLSRKNDINQVQVDDVVTDSTLSWGAKGVYAYLDKSLSESNGSILLNLSNYSKTERDEFNNYASELAKHDYLTIGITNTNESKTVTEIALQEGNNE